ncbi:putative clathrin heavy chain [Gregarina niphandrodes]|uniref:Clathrin heavy chain n=1 Tax=Gregarina niphandrodes TaxID=110365 RepID=A0A023BBU4_GRENI|nr:putative clathrin heavy chain [Gregarina niphandrodes]EZG81077.1 putative clathrin heavy chain [Gregarina niphandrodes]|eukprot:XP_011134273.1 putative clathrin heavy chain [Gregarina niphandrodes]
MLTSNSGPLLVNTLVSLLNEPYNFNEKAFRFNLTTFGGDRYICLKAPPTAQDAEPQVGIVDMYDDYSVERRSTRKADGAMKHPTEDVLALRGYNENASGQFIQVFDLTSKARLGEHAFKDDICYWRWLHDRSLVLISGEEIYHWDIRPSVDIPESSPRLVMRREGRLQSSDIQVINYSVDDPVNPLWALVAGIYLDESRVVRGSLQLYSFEKNQSQFLEGYAGCFGQLWADPTLAALEEDKKTPFLSFIEKKNDGPMKLYVMDIYAARGEGHPFPFKVDQEFTYPPEFANDFPLAAHFSKRHGVIYTASKNGHVMVFDALSGTRLITERVSTEGLFLAQPDGLTGGIKVVNRKGVVIGVSVNEFGLIQYIIKCVPNGVSIGGSLAKRYGYPEADEFVIGTFKSLFQSQRYKAAATLCALSKSKNLRSPTTMSTFRAAKTVPGMPSAALQYFTALLAIPGRLTAAESMELCRPAVNQQKKGLIDDWVNTDRLECNEALGDLIGTVDIDLALVVYQRANCHDKVLKIYGERGAFNKLMGYIRRKKCQADFIGMLRSSLLTSPESALEFARGLLENHATSRIDPMSVFELFAQHNRVRDITGVFSGLIGKVEFPKQSALETRILESSIAADPSTAELLFQQNIFKHYDRTRIGQLAEKAGLYKRALECYTDMADVKRVLSKSGSQLNIDWLSQYCANLPGETSLEILADTLRSSRGSLNAIVQIAVTYWQKLGIKNVFNMFEQTNCIEAVYLFAGAMVPQSDDPEVHFKYIQAAAKLNHWSECERMVKESMVYDPVRVKDLLKAADLTEPRAFIFVCDRHEFIEELTESLYRNDKMDYLEVYVSRVGVQNTPKVIETLLDLGCPEERIVSILQSVRAACPIEPLVSAMEKRGRLLLILPWMEERINEGRVDECLNNAVAKVYIDTNRDAAKFLDNNANYNAREIGKYCENKDPHMAVAAYIKGRCDDELIELTNKNGLYRIEAKYVLNRADRGLWHKVLSAPEDHRRGVLDQLMATALMDANSPSEVWCAIEAINEAAAQRDLLEILERIVVHKSIPADMVDEFANLTSLQDKLIFTAMDVDQEKARYLITKLDNITPDHVAEAALNKGMEKDALAIYQKHGMSLKALNVMLLNLKEVDTAEAFAESVQSNEVWNRLGEFCLNAAEMDLDTDLATDTHLGTGAVARAEQAGDMVVKCMNIYKRVDRCPCTSRIIEAAKKNHRLTELVDFLQSLRTNASSDHSVDTELAYAMAKTGKKAELEKLLIGVHTVNCQKLGDMLFDEAQTQQNADQAAGATSLTAEAAELYQLAKLFYAKVPNHAKLTACNVRLGDHVAAVETAKRAGSAKSWVDVALASIESGDWKVAHSSSLHVIEYVDHLEKVVQAYESHGRYGELINLLETGVNMGKQNIQLLTEMGICYAKYRPDKLQEFIASTTSTMGSGTLTSNVPSGLASVSCTTSTRLNIPRLIKVCDQERQWTCVVLLYLSYSEYDQAMNTILTHPESCWEPQQTVQVLLNVTNKDLVYKTVTFYIEEHPEMLNQLLNQIASNPVSSKIDYQRLIQCLRSHKRHLEAGNLAESPIGLLQPFFESEQRKANETTSIINDTLNELYIDYHDAEALKKSIMTYRNFDQGALARKLESHELLAMKQLALMLYKEDKKYGHAISLAKKFKQYAEAIGIAVQSQDTAVSENLVRYFVEDLHNANYFSASLQLCSKTIRPQVALELAWVHGMTQEVMPYLIQTVKSMSNKIEVLEKKINEKKDNPKLVPSPSLGNQPTHVVAQQVCTHIVQVLDPMSTTVII